MKDQKPKVVAKSAPKQSFVAGCPVHDHSGRQCDSCNAKCMCGSLN